MSNTSSVLTPISELTKALQSDPEYRRGWKDNIAMAFKDECARHKKKTGKQSLWSSEIHEIANKAAENFLKLLCKETEYPDGR